MTLATNPFPLWMRRFPVRRRDQVVFAEAVSQLLRAGLSLPDALELGATVCRGVRFRYAMREAVRAFQAGDPLSESIAWTRIGVAHELLSALAVGEDQGCLAQALAAFARRFDAQPAQRLASAVGRSREVVRFVATLAHLLESKPLTVTLIKDAMGLAIVRCHGFRRQALCKVVNAVADDVESGFTFSDALDRYPRTFDPLLRHCVRAASTRAELRRVLAAFGGDATPC